MALRLVQREKSAQLKSTPPARRSNREVRAREHLTIDEYRRVRDAAKKVGRYGFRDALLIEIMFRHGLRVSELVALTWDQIHFDDGTMYVVRVKGGTPATHYLEGEETRRLRQHKRQSDASRWVFCSERGAPLSTRAVHKIVARAGATARLEFTIHPHMLRHAKGFHLVQKGVDTRAIQGYLGHRDIKSTVVYTELSAARFKGFSSDE